MSGLMHAAITAVTLYAGQATDSGIAEYHQVIRMVADSRAEIVAGQPDGYTWRCIDEKNPCIVEQGDLHAR